MNVLIVEDDRLIAELEERILDRDGESAKSVTTREAAEREIADSPPDLILADLQLTEGTSEDTVEFLARYTKSIPVVICSGNYHGRDGLRLRQACAKIGCVAYLDKYAFRVTTSHFTEELRQCYRRFHGLESDGASIRLVGHG